MSTDGLTPDVLKQQHAAVIAKSDTFEPHGISKQAALDYLKTDEGALYYWRVAEAAEPGLSPDQITRRAVNQLRSGRELPRMETIQPGESVVKFVAEGQPLSAYSPYWARESQANAAIAAGRNISDYYGLPIASEAPRYDMYRMTPKVPTQIFISTVAPTSELDGLVTKQGNAEQALVPNRGLFHEPVRFRTVDNIPALAAERGIASDLTRGAGVLGAAAVAYDATTSIARTSDLLHRGNTLGAKSEIEHFGSRNLGMLGGAALGAELAGTAGIESGPFDFLIAGAGGVVGAVAGDKLADAHDRHKIYNQTDPQGVAWHYDAGHPQQGWTRTVTDAFAERGLSRTHVETASPALAGRLTFQANNTAVELALAHPAPPRDPYTQPANAHDTASFGDPPWRRDPHTGTWQREIRAPFVERGMTPPSYGETATPQRAAELDAATEQVIAANFAASKRGIAERYHAIYLERGWSQYGPMPRDVANALKTPTHSLQASNGNTHATHGPREIAADTTQPVFSDPSHPQHAMYAHLKALMPPRTSEARLAQATAACHLGGMHVPEDLERIHCGKSSLVFMPNNVFGHATAVDLSQPSPSVQQSLQQVQAFDQQQALQQQRMQQIDMQQQAPLQHCGPGL